MLFIYLKGPTELYYKSPLQDVAMMLYRNN